MMLKYGFEVRKRQSIEHCFFHDLVGITESLRRFFEYKKWRMSWISKYCNAVKTRTQITTRKDAFFSLSASHCIAGFVRDKRSFGFQYNNKCIC